MPDDIDKSATSPESSENTPEDLTPLPATSDPMAGMFPKRGRGIGALIFVIIISGLFGYAALLANWPRERPEAEPLPPTVRKRLSGLPLNANVVAYLGLKEIRQSEFWQNFVPDSLKEKLLADTSSPIGRFASMMQISFAQDIDTAIYTEVNRYGEVNVSLAILIGRFNSARLKQLAARALDSIRAGNYLGYQLEPTLWWAKVSENELVLSSHADALANYLQPKADFWATDSTITPLIERAQYKSHFWLALGSARWAFDAMRGLTSGNRDMQGMGNIRNIRQLVLSLKLTDGIEGQSEWIYDSRAAAFFAGGLIGITLWVTKNFSQRQSESIKKLVGTIDFKQNLEALMFHAVLPKTLLEELRQAKQNL
ncbi:MAG: hypothetical protein D0433_11130 [Candidatus Thermochlorobacter aerophilum]|jgi:hypothetical protein|uniref:Uncharacterized protein n=1 Tax=Candidatus Thermochlorobacter aerophilus TaxID=1868324 RepID=A0A395LY56_9BACT|nr:MAG: hypothetical protein D0433_11130 [Candidatus Thermochlorobacter aerophilum]